MAPFWITTNGPAFAQGDWLRGCLVPSVADDFGLSGSTEIRVHTADLIVLTQSCDLANLKSGLVALCPVYSLADFERVNPQFAKRGMWEEVRKGRREGLHLLASAENPEVSREAVVVNFREIISLPMGYLQTHAGQLGSRWRLQSPYLEHFSQAFARFFMRVGLPSAIPPFPA